MKIDKRLQKIVKKFVNGSFTFSGELLEIKVKEYSKILSSFATSDAITGLSAYVKGLKRELGKTTLEIRSPTPLSKTQVEKMAQVVKSKNRVNQVKLIVDESLLGGVRVRIGDLVYDDSVSQKINQLKGVIYG